MRWVSAVLLLAGIGAAVPARAQGSGAGGEELYRAICQGCHMPDGAGAAGAARYPGLANNASLAAADYAVTVVLRGQRAMPGFGAVLGDADVAAVVTFIRTNFGNAYDEAVTAAFVRAAR